MAGPEWSWGTLKLAVARGQSRSVYVVATFASISVILLDGLLIAYLAGMLASFAGASGGPPGTLASVNALDPNVALLITVAWLVGCLTVTCLAVERTEITG
jgi:hypothetical protein